ncbi:hypothetical protein ABUR84_14245, partial [Staphylococcus aureus]|uniref:hypothetical protein n=1 Tax=Staphylococcus aureus TaxID=1280 RepID=UPI0033905046
KPEREDEPGRPARPRLTRAVCSQIALIGLFVFAAVAVLGVAKSFLVPVVLAFLLSMVFGPVRRVFDRRGVPAFVSS